MCLTEKCVSKSPARISGSFISSVVELLALHFIARAKSSGGMPDLRTSASASAAICAVAAVTMLVATFMTLASPIFPDDEDFLAASFQDRARLFQGRFVAADVINELAFFRRDFAPGEGRFEKTRAAPLHDLGRRPHAFRRDRAMRGHDVLRGQTGDELFDHFEQRFVIRDKDLDDVAELGDFDR